MSDYAIKNMKDLEDSAVQFGLSPQVEARFGRKALDAQKGGVSYQRYEADYRQSFGHTHEQQEEIYVIVSGGGRMKLGDEVVDRLDVVLGLFGLLAQLDNVAVLEQHALTGDAPLRRAPEQELEVHREVLELLLLRVRHDRLGVVVLLDVHALFVPVDRLGFLDQRLDHAREGPRLLRQLLRRLVVLVEAHDSRSLLCFQLTAAGA
jgi:hypothetical protein